MCHGRVLRDSGGLDGAAPGCGGRHGGGGRAQGQDRGGGAEGRSEEQVEIEIVGFLCATYQHSSTAYSWNEETFHFDG